MVRYGTIWHDMQYGTLWHDMVQYGTIWPDIVAAVVVLVRMELPLYISCRKSTTIDEIDEPSNVLEQPVYSIAYCIILIIRTVQ